MQSRKEPLGLRTSQLDNMGFMIACFSSVFVMGACLQQLM
jgi:hypothetical protein